jgi:hypothetical protein
LPYISNIRQLKSVEIRWAFAQHKKPILETVCVYGKFF